MKLRVAVPQHQACDVGGISTYGRGLSAALAIHASDAVSVFAPGRREQLQGPAQRWMYEQTVLAARMRATDIVHMSDLRVPAVLHDRVVATVHDIGFVTHPELFDVASRCYKTIQLNAAIRLRPALVACDSEYTRTLLAEHYPPIADRTAVLIPGIHGYNGPPADVQAHKPHFLTVGSYDRRKNLKTLLNAFRALRRGGSELEWVAVGPTERAPRDLLKAMNTEPGVTVTGRVSDAELERLWSDAAFLAVPSVLEGFGFPGLEAMQRSVPVIASAGSALDETVGEHGLRPRFDDVATWTEMMGELHRSESLRARLVRTGLAHVAGFAWEARTPAFLDAYRAFAVR